MCPFNRLVLLLFCLCSALICVFGAFNDCQKPNGETDVCIDYRNCPSLYALASKPDITEVERTQLISSICDYSDDGYNVCCPREVEQEEEEEEEEECITPDDNLGTCMDARNCDTIMTLIEQPVRTVRENNYIQVSIEKCKHSGKAYSVCCAKPPPRESPIDTQIQACRTKHGANGICTTLANCQPLSDALQIDPRSQADYLSGECQGLDDLYCCPVEEEEELPFDNPDTEDQPPDEECLTPDGYVGQCIDIRNCSSLITIAQNPLRTPEEIQYLKDRICHYTEDSFTICCPNQDSNENTLEPPEEEPNLNQPCQTPHGVSGLCTILQNCQSLSELYNADNPTQAVLQFIQDSECDNGNSYCCPIKQEFEDTTTTTSKTTTTTTLAPPPEICETANGLNGTCISLHHCVPLMKIMQNKEFAAADIKYLNASFCGDGPNFPKVCCPATPTADDSTLPQPPYCGRVSGGEHDFDAAVVATSEEYPWSALLLYKNKKGQISFHCGGTLIHERFVLTAAHCLEEQRYIYNLTGVRLGVWAPAVTGVCQEGQTPEDVGCVPSYIDVALSSVIKHPEYESVNNDLALLQLEHTVSATRYIAPLCLPYESRYLANIYDAPVLHIAGWGVKMMEQPAQFKMKAILSVKNFPQCQKQYSDNAIGLSAERHICAAAQDVADSAYLDSGGALMALTKIGKLETYFLVAVEALNYEDALKSGFPGVFTHISNYLSWIKQEIHGNSI